MLFSVILTLVPLTVSAMPASNVPTRSIFDRQVCYGCIESSACTGTVDVNNLAMTNNPDVANVFSMWIDMFGNDGSMANNGDVYDKGLCCGGWCIIMENTAAYDIDYTCDQISAIDFTSQGGCSKYYDRINDSYYLKLVCASSAYSDSTSGSIVTEYGDYCAGALVFNGPAPGDGGGFS